ncbi:MAG: hypothetical protein MK161_05005 [Pirellulales bacterium]|nr:hypothetical protein [Pirellulales bacterium]
MPDTSFYQPSANVPNWPDLISFQKPETVIRRPSATAIKGNRRIVLHRIFSYT